MFSERDHYWMEQALQLAKKAAAQGEVPVGAVLVYEDRLLGEGWNCPISEKDPTAHAEVIALRQAAKAQQNYRLPQSTLYVTLEPCLMCVGALTHARVKRVVYGASDPKSGAVMSAFQLANAAPPLNHRILYEHGLLAEPCSALLKNFFQARR